MTEVSAAHALGLGDPLVLARLTDLTGLSAGTLELPIGLVDGPADAGHPELAGATIHHVGGAMPKPPDCAAAQHATFAAGVLVGRRPGATPALVPRCPLLVRPIFTAEGQGTVLSASPADLADALTALVAAGARVINVSVEMVSAAAPQAATNRTWHASLASYGTPAGATAATGCARPAPGGQPVSHRRLDARLHAVAQKVLSKSEPPA
jgi:subtilisin family serine protease